MISALRSKAAKPISLLAALLESFHSFCLFVGETTIKILQAACVLLLLAAFVALILVAAGQFMKLFQGTFWGGMAAVSLLFIFACVLHAIENRKSYTPAVRSQPPERQPITCPDDQVVAGAELSSFESVVDKQLAYFAARQLEDENVAE